MRGNRFEATFSENFARDRPEEAGVVDRNLLLDVAGRGRKVQLSLASNSISLAIQLPRAVVCSRTRIFQEG